MFNKTLTIVAFAVAAFAAPAALANQKQNQNCGVGQYGSQDCGSAYSGEVNRYCPAGQIPHVFPGGSGYRCEDYDGRL